jgi:hypothetical protein
MSTVRLQIVSAIAAALGTATGLVVYRNLDFALEDRNLPALVVRSLQDHPADSFISFTEHQAEIEIVVLIAGTADPESAADPYEALIHAAIFASGSFAGHAVVMERISGSWDFELGDCCARHLVYRISYRTTTTSLEA